MKMRTKYGKRGYGSTSRFFYCFIFCAVLIGCSYDYRSENKIEGSEWLNDGLKITVKKERWEQIEEKREEILDSNYHFKYAKDYVKVKLKLGDRKLFAKMRFKGGEVDHYQGEHWSFKIKAKVPLFLGYKKIGIQGPQTKNGLLEYLFHRVCSKEGIIALPYHFLPVQINNRETSTYALEPVIGQATLMHNGRREGAIIKMKKDAYWRLMVSGLKNIDSISMLKAKIVPVEKKWTKQSEKNARASEKAATLLDQYRKKEISSRDVFDYKQFAKYIAISELFGSSHNLRWLNLRLYLNPETDKLEPIAFDCYDGQDPRNDIIWFIQEKRFEYLLHPLLDEQEFRALVYDQLDKITREDYIRSIFSDEHAALSYYQDIIRENETKYKLNRDQMFRRGKSIRSQLDFN